MMRRNVMVRVGRSVGMAALLLAVALPVPGEARAQGTGAQRASRSELSARATQLEQQLASGSLRGDARTRATLEVGGIRKRLQDGDFRVGDRFVATIRVDSVRSDTLVVRDSMQVAVFNLPEMNVRGVLRSELEERLNQHVARYLRNASVRTAVLTRVNVTGAVARPGIYYVAPDRPIIDLITLAGGPAPQARLDRIEIKRGGNTLLSGKASDKLVKAGGTLEQADVQSGDDMFVPTKRKINWQVVMQLFFIISSLLFAFLQFLQWYYNRQDG